jgi:signal transduction histidine kinase
MKKRKTSLIISIALMIFLSFAFVLGNEVRLGVDRYVSNTLTTEASNNARNLEKLETVYIESMYSNNSTHSLDTKEFQNEFKYFLDDSTKLTCLTDKDGNIKNITRANYENPIIHLIKDDTQGPIYFNISSLDNDQLGIIEDFLLKHTSEDLSLYISFKNYTEKQAEIDTFSDITITKLTILSDTGKLDISIDDENDDVKTYEGYLGYYEDLDYQFMYEVENSISNNIYDGLNGEIVKEKVVIYDFSQMRKNLEDQINNHFEEFTTSGNMFMSTNYSDYYLLKLIETESPTSYSTTMCKFVDWMSVSEEDIDSMAELENKATEGYCFVVTMYDHLYLEAVKDFMIDNISTYSLAIVFIGLICIALAYFIVKPIRQVEQAARAITQNNFHYPLTYKRHDEIGSLSNSINIMSNELEKTINNLHLEVTKTNELEELRKDFVSNFTHEIKTPLGIINGFSELIELEEDKEKRNEYIQIIQKETKKINELVLEMLELSKLESRNITLDLEDVDIVELCEHTIDKLQYAIINNNITIQKDYHPCIIKADYLKIEMVIVNFISNAIKHTKNANIYITINERGFYIENEGQQINALDKVWLAFYKDDKARSNVGTGLGLSICKGILDLHNYKYEALNTARGVLFYFEFNKD